MEALLRPSRSADLNVQLVTSLSSFVRVYDRSKPSLLLAVRRLESCNRDPRPRDEGVGLLSLLAGTVGAVVGGLTGGVFGALGGVAAATYTRIFRHVTAVGASVGLFGGVLGGLVGGGFSGAIGCAVEVAAAGSGRPVSGFVSRALFLTLGCSSGGAFGSIFGGGVGTAAGALGAALGALCARISAVYVAAGTVGYSSRNREPRFESSLPTSEETAKELGALVEKLGAVQRISGSLVLKGTWKVALQTKKTLRAVSAAEKTWLESSSSCWSGGLKQFQDALKELGTMEAVAQETLQRDFKARQRWYPSIPTF